jgi:hypothetical protein
MPVRKFPPCPVSPDARTWAKCKQAHAVKRWLIPQRREASHFPPLESVLAGA